MSPVYFVTIVPSLYSPESSPARLLESYGEQVKGEEIAALPRSLCSGLRLTAMTRSQGRGGCRAEFTPSASLRAGLSRIGILRFAQNDNMEKAQNDKRRRARNDDSVEGEEIAASFY